MNWNLRNQILLPISIVFLLGITIATTVNVTNLMRAEKQKIDSQVHQLIDTIEEKSFPLTDSVLRQIQSITSVQLIVKFNDEEAYASSFDSAQNIEEVLNQDALKQPIASTAHAEVKLGNQEYFAFHRELNTRSQEVFAFYPKQQLSDSINRAIWPQVFTGLLTLLVTIGLFIWVSKSVTRPIQELQRRVEKIADGNFEIANENDSEFTKSIQREDEIGEFYRCIYQMANKLKLYEERIRNQEKLFTLDQMGGGIAHQMRNSITGCRLALDFHREVCGVDSESLDVAHRQLRYMEDFQKRFLAIGREHDTNMQPIEIGGLIKNYLPLLEPVAKHVAVSLLMQIPEKEIVINGNLNRLEQVLNNLLLNAIEAASSNLQESNKQVSIIVEEDSDLVVLIVRDNGLGVSEEIKNRLYEPLATTKADGVGLGLAIVKQTVEDHNGTIQWTRVDGRTDFVMKFPVSKSGSNQKQHV